MPNFKARSTQLELLDAEDIPRHDLEQNLKELEFINTYLGGHKVILSGIKRFRPSSILEIGSGGGDNLRAIASKFPEDIKYFGVDLKAECTQFAQKSSPSNIHFVTDDYKNSLQHIPKPDVIFNSLFCHHFKDKDLVEMLQWMYQNCEKGFVIGDLHRHPLAYFSIKLLTYFFSKSYLVKNDAPLSVLRGFKRSEWEQLLKNAKITHYTIEWKWAFRHLIVVHKP